MEVHPTELEIRLSLVNDEEAVGVLIDTQPLVRLEHSLGEFDSHHILEVPTEVGEKEHTLLHDSNVRLLENTCITMDLRCLKSGRSLSQILFSSLMEKYLLLFWLSFRKHLSSYERSSLRDRHFTSLSAMPNSYCKFSFSFLHVSTIVLQLRHGRADNVDEVPKQCTAEELNEHGDCNLVLILRSDVSVPDCHDSRNGPV